MFVMMILMINYVLNDDQDSTFEFEKRRNIPVRYNRTLIAQTIGAIQRVGEIRQRREHAFWKNRMASNKVKQRMADRAAVRKNTAILPRLRATASLQTAAKQKIKMPLLGRKAKATPSALVRGEGRSMAMEVDR